MLEKKVKWCTELKIFFYNSEGKNNRNPQSKITHIKDLVLKTSQMFLNF